MSARFETLVWFAQRITAAILAVAVTVHLITIAYAMDGGLSAREILDRIQGNGAWLAFYVTFVVAVAIHAPIGLRAVLREITPLRLNAIDGLMWLLFVLLLWTGLRAVLGLYGVLG
ncbi:MAG: succinate dehydrogenase [Rhodospirillales bacterium]